MQAMILAAGLGRRMRPLTDDTPKTLLKVNGKPLIEHHIERLAAAGVGTVVINLFHLGGRIQEALGTLHSGVRIRYSREAVLLGTGGGIIKALPLLEDESFIVLNGDVWTDFDYSRLQPVDGESRLGHLVLVNEAGDSEGDFYLDADGRVHKDPPAAREQAGDDSSTADVADTTNTPLTFSGISVLHKNLFRDMTIQTRPLAPMLKEAMQGGCITGEIHAGLWMDIGTPDRLKEANLTAGDPPSAPQQ